MKLRSAPRRTKPSAPRLVVEATQADAATACARELIAAADAAILSLPAAFQLLCHVDGDEVRRSHGLRERRR